jgi:phage gp36-like protein
MTTTTYLTRAQLEALFGVPEIARLETDGAGVQATLDTVNDEVDSYVRAARPEGLVAVPKALEMAAANIARFYLQKGNAAPVVELRWTHALKYLRDISAGKVALPAIPDDPATPDDESTLGSGVWFTTVPWNPKGWM